MEADLTTLWGQDEIDRLPAVWERWLDALHVILIALGDGVPERVSLRDVAALPAGCLAVWLDVDVEREVDALWQIRPSSALAGNALAGALCMSAVAEVVPEVAQYGCAPLIEPDAALRDWLERSGVINAMQGTSRTIVPVRRYTVLTPFPFRRGCGVCALRAGCVRARMRARDGCTPFG